MFFYITGYSQGVLTFISFAIIILFIWNNLIAKLYEVTVKGNFIIFKNLYTKKKYSSDKFIGVKNAFFSPLIYYIELDGSKRFYFQNDIKTIFKHPSEYPEGWEEIIRQNFDAPKLVDK